MSSLSVRLRNDSYERPAYDSELHACPNGSASDTDAVAVTVQLPFTINGRIFPREDVDLWAFEACKGQTIACEVWAARLGSPLDSHLEVLDPHGRKIAENDDTFGPDSFVRFTAA